MISRPTWRGTRFKSSKNLNTLSRKYHLSRSRKQCHFVTLRPVCIVLYAFWNHSPRVEWTKQLFYSEREAEQDRAKKT